MRTKKIRPTKVKSDVYQILLFRRAQIRKAPGSEKGSAEWSEVRQTHYVGRHIKIGENGKLFLLHTGEASKNKC